MRIKLSKREILLVSVLAAAVLLYAYLTYLLLPSYARISELQTELIIKEKVVAEKEETLMQLEFLDEFMEKSRQELEAIEKKIPYNVKLPEIVVNIDRRITALGMNIKSISVGEPDTVNKEYDIVPVNVSLEGRYDNIIAFIKYIEDNERKYIIDSFKLAPVVRAEAIPFDISMRAFVLKEGGKDPVPEPEDYEFFKHENGKGYPFLEGSRKVKEDSDTLIKDIEVMQMKYESLEEMLKGLKGKFRLN